MHAAHTRRAHTAIPLKAADLYGGAPLPESAPLLPVSPYGVSKVATENLASEMWVRAAILRPEMFETASGRMDTERDP